MDLLSLEVLYCWGYTRQFVLRVYLFLQANLSGSYPQHSFQIVRICIAVLHMEGGNFLELSSSTMRVHELNSGLQDQQQKPLHNELFHPYPQPPLFVSHILDHHFPPQPSSSQVPDNQEHSCAP